MYPASSERTFDRNRPAGPYRIEPQAPGAELYSSYAELRGERESENVRYHRREIYGEG